MKRYLSPIMVLALVLAGLAPAFGCSTPRSTTGAGMRAAIIDQLYNLQPNQAFIDEAVTILEEYGFTVDVYQGANITVDFYKKLPDYGHRLIIFRVHSGALRREHKSELIEGTYLLTNETYTEMKHIVEQLSERIAVTRATEQSPYVFAVGSKFVSLSMEGLFPNTVIIMMGCSTIRFPDMATAFIEKGASTYLGWDASVDLGFVDKATLNLITNLCIRNMTVEESVISTRSESGADPFYNAHLWCHPPESSRLTLAELIR